MMIRAEEPELGEGRQSAGSGGAERRLGSEKARQRLGSAEERVAAVEDGAEWSGDAVSLLGSRRWDRRWCGLGGLPA